MSGVTPNRNAAPASLEEVRSGGGLMVASGNFLSTVIPIVGIMLLWELAVRLSHVPPAILPPLSNIFLAIWKMAYEGTLWTDIGATLGRLIKSWWSAWWLARCSAFSWAISGCGNTRWSRR